MFKVPSFRALRRSLGSVFALALLAVTPVVSHAQTNTPSSNDGFDPNVDGVVYAVATQADGKILIGGVFTNVGGVGCANLARLNINGSVDTSFSPSFNDKVTSIVVQPDGNILVGGYFTSVTGTGGTTSPRGGLARLTSTGALDATFDPNVGGPLAPGVETIALQADGRIIAGGTFTTVQTNHTGTVVTHNRLARFSSTGVLDASFDPNPDRVVLSVALQSDGQVIVGGGFTKIQANGATDSTPRIGLARLHTDGSLDLTWDPDANNGTVRVLVQGDGKVVAGGYFTTVAPNGAGGTSVANHIVRLNTDGSIDTGFTTNINGNVMAMALQGDGSILVGGAFNTVSNTRRAYVARIRADGSVDSVFDPSADFTVFAVAEQANGSVLLGGAFTRLQPNGAASGTTRNHMARVNASGTLDSNFSPDTNGRVNALVLQSDGKTLVGGSFTSIGGLTRNYLARLNSDGTVDTSFDAQLNGEIDAIALQSDGKILIGGLFSTIKGAAFLNMARLNSDGSVDASYQPSPLGQVFSIAVQSDGKAIAGGSFTAVRPNGSAATLVRNFIARFNTDGSLDSPFDPNSTGSIYVVKIQSDGNILVGGLFTGFLTANRSNIARIKPDGTIDPDYNPTADRQVNTIALQSDGKAIIGGTFNSLQPSNGPLYDYQTTAADGTPVTGQTNVVQRHNVARLNTDGTVDISWDPNPDNAVLSIGIQSDQKILLGGVFGNFNVKEAGTIVTRNYLARVNADGTLDDTYNANVDVSAGDRVLAIVVRSDGSALVGGLFQSFNSVARSQLAHITVQGTLDASYAPNAGGSSGAVINSVTLQADGGVLLGGSFSGLGGTSSHNLARFDGESVPDNKFNPDPNGPVNSVVTRIAGGPNGTQLANFAWLKPDGSLLNTFLPNSGNQISGQINAVVVQPDGKLLIGGSVADNSGSVAGYIIRYNTDGTIDRTFNPGPSGAVEAIALQSDGSIIIGGAFVTIGTVARQYIARLDSNGVLDANFDPKADAAVTSIVVQPDGKILIAGSFANLMPNGTTITYSASHIARLNTDGTFDSSFRPTINGLVNTIALQSDGQVVIGGAFTNITETSTSSTLITRNNIARLASDGTLDKNFDPNAGSTVNSIVIQPDGKMVIGGFFTFLQANGSPTIITRNYVARINNDGSLDASYDPNLNGGVLAMAQQADGKVIVGGLFTQAQPNGSSQPLARNNLLRLNTDGTVDGSFDPSPSGRVQTINVRPDGTIIAAGLFDTVEPSGTIVVGGSFSQIGGFSIKNLALLSVGGSAFASFLPNPNGSVYALATRADNRLLVAGGFTSIAGASRSGLAQLAADGTIDSSFNSGASVAGSQAALLIQPDGKALVGGSSVGFGGAARGALERLNVDGSLDGSFNPSVTGTVNALALQADGKILVGTTAGLVRLNADGSVDGSFSPAPNGAVNSLAVQSDGYIIVAGSFTSIGGLSVSNLARLTPAGTADASYNPNVNGPITATALYPDGKVLFGGSFTQVGTRTRYGLARVAMTSPSNQSIQISSDYTTLTWSRTGSGPELTAAVFEKSSDSRTWIPLGQASRVGASDTWQLSGLSLSTGGTLFIRARGVIPTSRYSSSGVVVTVKQFVSGSLPVILSASTATATSGSTFYYGVVTNVSNATFSATGLPAGLSIDPSSGIISGTPTQTGVFAVTLRVSNSGGVATQTLTLTIAAPGSGGTAIRFANLSARGRVTPTDPLIAGLVIGGSTSRTILLRAIGPGLAAYGVGSPIPHPHMRLYDGNHNLLNENEGWGGSSSLTAVFNQVGAFPLTAGSLDSAMVVTLAPGTYSVVVTDSSSTDGIALAEVYDTGTDNSVSAPHLVNISARATANSGNTVLIGGFVVNGPGTKHILVRGVGPTLANYGVSSGFMTDPVLRLYDSANTLLAQNDNWQTAVTIIPSQPGASGSDISTATTQAGGFPLTSGSADAAIIVNLPAGTYSAQVSNAAGTDGTALVEIYELP